MTSVVGSSTGGTAVGARKWVAVATGATGELTTGNTSAGLVFRYEYSPIPLATRPRHRQTTKTPARIQIQVLLFFLAAGSFAQPWELGSIVFTACLLVYMVKVYSNPGRA